MDSIRSKLKPALRPWILVAAYGLMLVSWVLTNPAGSAPDEYAHYLRALGAGRGELILNKPPPALQGESRKELALRWQQKQARMVSIPARLSPEAFNCRAIPGRVEACTTRPPNVKGAASFRSWVGTYPPFDYIAPGLVMRLGDTPVRALMIGRLVSAATSFALLAAGVWVLWDPRRPWSCLLGLMAAVTPMVIFVGSTLSASGPEVAGGICFFACLLRLIRPEPSDRKVWAVAGVSGVVLALSRDLGAVWIGTEVLIAFGLNGIAKTWNLVRAAGMKALVASAAVAVSVVVSAFWEETVQPHPPLGIKTLTQAFTPTWGFLREIVRQQIGVFGPLDTVMPGPAYFLWGLMLVLLVALAFFVGTRRQSLVLIAVFGVNLFLDSALDAVQRSVGFGAQGRHLLPLAVAIPLLAGEVVFVNQHKLASLRPNRLLAWFGVLAAGGYLLAWLSIARRYAGGLKAAFLSGRPSWTPPLGWGPWAILIGAAVATVLVFAFLSSGPPDLRPALDEAHGSG